MDTTELVIPGITDSATLACIARSRSYKQYCIMVEDALAHRCPFCTINPETNRVIAEKGLWCAWQSPAPEKYTKHHFIIVPRRHIVDTEELSNVEMIEFFGIMKMLRANHGYAGRGILIRDGDATLSAGTIQHLHAHVMVPDGTGRVESPFYKGEKAERESLERALVFEKMRQGHDIGDLSPYETNLVEGRIYE